jgi:hypothetical protein
VDFLERKVAFRPKNEGERDEWNLGFDAIGEILSGKWTVVFF